MTQYDYKCDLQVRDYEIDMQGIVHHAIYVNYLELARSGYVATLGIDAHQYHAMGYDIVVISLAQHYKSSLRPHEKFYVTVNMNREGRLKCVFEQEIRREKDDSLVLTAKVVTVCVNIKTGKPCMPKMLEEALEDAMVEQ